MYRLWQNISHTCNAIALLTKLLSFFFLLSLLSSPLLVKNVNFPTITWKFVPKVKPARVVEIDVFIPIWDIRCCFKGLSFRSSSSYTLRLFISMAVSSSHSSDNRRRENLSIFHPLFRPFIRVLVYWWNERKQPIFLLVLAGIFLLSLLLFVRGWHRNEIYDYGLEWNTFLLLTPNSSIRFLRVILFPHSGTKRSMKNRKIFIIIVITCLCYPLACWESRK